MSKRKLLLSMLVASFLAMLLGCSVSQEAHKTVEVTSGETPEENSKLAEVVAQEVWNNAIVREIREAIPEIKKDDFLKHMSLRWGATEFTSFTDKKNNRTLVFIRCSTTHPDAEYTRIYLKICEDVVNEELTKRASSDVKPLQTSESAS